MNDGAVILGSDYRGLGVVQSLGRRDVPLVLLHERGRGVANFSRYVRKAIRWPDGDERSRTEFLLDLAGREGLRGWTLIPTRDETAALCSRNAADLEPTFRLSVPSWDILRCAHDKRLTHQLAADIGIPFPRTWEVGCNGVDGFDCEYPVIIKPAVKSSVNALTIAKAWRADGVAALRRRYQEASQLMVASDLLVQELVPGAGEVQLSFAALAAAGRPIATMVARRTRQTPMDFGRASTFVETIDDQEVAEFGAELIAAMGYTGLIEIEFKRDSRTTELKLLDLNTRVWGWHTVGRRTGTDFSWLLWRLLHGDTPRPVRARTGVRWMWLPADIPIVVREIIGGRLSLRDYARDFRRPIDFATLVLDDPVPGLLEVPLHLARALDYRRRGEEAVPVPMGLPVA
jgi:D-aspartate ligase